MDHLTPSHEGDKVRSSSFLAWDANTTSVPDDLYVGHIPADVDSNVLKAFFSQFGEIGRIFEGRTRQSYGGMKWAFISYIHPEDTVKHDTRLLNF